VVIDDTNVKITNIRKNVEPYIFKDFCIKIASSLLTHKNLSLPVFI